jgi:hypothetical protein
MIRPGSARGRRTGVSSAVESRPRPLALVVCCCRSMPVSALLGAAVLAWLAGVWLSGLAGSAGSPASPAVVPVVSVAPSAGADGSNPDDQSGGGGAPKSPGTSHPQAKDAGDGTTANNSGSGAKRPASTPASKPDSGQASGTQQPPQDHHPARPQTAPGDNGTGTNNGGQTGAPKPPPQSRPQPGAGAGDNGNGTPPRTPAPGSRRPDPGTNPGDGATPKPPPKPQAVPTGSGTNTPRVRPVSMTSRLHPGEGTTPGNGTGTPRPGQPGRPDPNCQPGGGNCGGSTPPPPSTPAPVPTSAGSGGGSTGGPGGTGGQPGTDNTTHPAPPVRPPQTPEAQQPNGQVTKHQDPRTGTDPPTAGETTSCSSGVGPCAPAPSTRPSNQPNQNGIPGLGGFAPRNPAATPDPSGCSGQPCDSAPSPRPRSNLTDEQAYQFGTELAHSADGQKDLADLVQGYKPGAEPTHDQLVEAGHQQQLRLQHMLDSGVVTEDPDAAKRGIPHVPDPHKLADDLRLSPYEPVSMAAGIADAGTYFHEGKTKEGWEAAATSLPLTGKIRKLGNLLGKGTKLFGRELTGGERAAEKATPPPAARPPGSPEAAPAAQPAPKPAAPKPAEGSAGQTAAPPNHPGDSVHVARPPDSVHVARPPDSVHVARPPDSVHVARPPDSRMSAKKPDEGKKDDGVVYLRTNKDGGKYVGRAKNEDRYQARKGEHSRANPDARYDFKKIGGGKTERDLRRSEQENIDAHGGPKTKKNPQGKLENKRNEVSKKKRWW